MIVIEYNVEGKPDILSIDASVKDFDKFTPKDFEGSIHDDSGEYAAWFDDFENLHWLVKLTTGHISYYTVRCTEIIEELAYNKYH
jgi:hypothetical protein